MNQSILNTIKLRNNVDTSDTSFDEDLIGEINACMFALAQAGLRSSLRSITGATETWASYLGSADYAGMVKDYIYYKTKYVFDPSASSTIQNAYKERADEWFSRISYEVDKEVSDDE